MNNNVSNTLQITTKHFEPNPNGKGYEYNGNQEECIANFYNITDKEKNVLFALQKGFNEFSQQLIEKEITSMSQYLEKIEVLNDLAKTEPNILIGSNEKNEMIVYLNAKLKEEFQLDSSTPIQKVNKKPAIFSLYSIEWEESERGWGVRPDGFSFHSSIEESEQFLKDFFANQPKEVPEEYSRPVGKAKLLEVSESLHDYVLNNGSIWLSPKNAEAYKNYDASALNKPKKKM